jgi:hypothetical protein
MPSPSGSHRPEYNASGSSPTRRRRPKTVTHPSWGEWHLDTSNLTLVFRHWTLYYIDLEDCTTSAATLDVIFQIASKTWATPDVIGGLIQALDDILHPQATLCSFGGERGPINVK